MSKRTHIWLITTDQMRADALGIENASVLTPELDKLVSEGTLFTGAYCASPVCTPSRSSIFTGRYPHVHGAWNIGTALREDELTLCDHLKTANYKTIGIGKMHFRPQMKGDFHKNMKSLLIVTAEELPMERTTDLMNIILRKTIVSGNIWSGLRNVTRK